MLESHTFVVSYLIPEERGLVERGLFTSRFVWPLKHSLIASEAYTSLTMANVSTTPAASTVCRADVSARSVPAWAGGSSAL